MNRLILAGIVLGMLALAGCADKSEMALKGAQVMDQATDVAVWQLCYGASVGALRREFRGDTKRIEAWRTLCEGTSPMLPYISTDELPGTAAGFTADPAPPTK